jgi:hypothetical protein
MAFLMGLYVKTVYPLRHGPGQLPTHPSQPLIQ